MWMLLVEIIAIEAGCGLLVIEEFTKEGFMWQQGCKKLPCSCD
jgi:hypothetical protein